MQKHSKSICPSRHANPNPSHSISHLGHSFHYCHSRASSRSIFSFHSLRPTLFIPYLLSSFYASAFQHNLSRFSAVIHHSSSNSAIWWTHLLTFSSHLNPFPLTISPIFQRYQWCTKDIACFTVYIYLHKYIVFILLSIIPCQTRVTPPIHAVCPPQRRCCQMRMVA